MSSAIAKRPIMQMNIATTASTSVKPRSLFDVAESDLSGGTNGKSANCIAIIHADHERNRSAEGGKHAAAGHRKRAGRAGVESDAAVGHRERAAVAVQRGVAA